MPLQDGQVFVVDDDADAREAVAALVRTLGLRVTEFDSAESFLKTYRGARPACVVADLRMLNMSGLEMLLELRRRGLSIPVIILTAYADTPTTVQAMKSGAFTTLDKPCRDSELWETIRAALQEDVRRGEEDQQRRDIAARLESLTPPEREVLERVLKGEPNKAIAHRLGIGLRTVESRRQSIAEKMQADSLAELVKLVVLAQPDWLPAKGS